MEGYKRVVFLAALLTLFNSCNKNGDVIEITKVLQLHSWRLHQTQEVTYRNAPAGYQLFKDTVYSPDPCNSKTTYTFFADHSFIINHGCYSQLSGTGKWSVNNDNYLSALVRETVSQPSPGGQLYYIGIEGLVSAFDPDHLTVKRSRVFFSFNGSSTFKDSMVSIYLYNR